MKKHILLMLVVCCTMSSILFAQKSNKELANEYLNIKGEAIFSFVINNASQLSTITKELSIVHYDENTKTVKVMANSTQFSAFLQKNIPFKISAEDNIIGNRTMTSDLTIKAATFPLTAYPTYADYVTMMNEFATNNPTLCKIENIGATTEGDKSILFVKLSDNVANNEKEPRVMYTSSMHGDEIAGYPMMLNLIDYLLVAYKDSSHPKHAEIKNLLDNNEVWINPLANPDGTYRNSTNNTSVANATRGNANNVDLNRNYPDPDDGANPDGNSYQTETLAFMGFADSKHFVLSANFHGGIELINYPWDTYAGAHPDEDYFLHISKEYRDHCQSNSPNGYFDDRNNGITNGFAWYEVQGGRQDYQIYNQKGREVTVELSNAKTPPANQLVNYWNYNRDALIAFLKQVNYGIRGVVTDAITNQPIDAKITIVGKENYQSWVPTELPDGDYYRPVKAGTYNVLYEAECYQSVTLTGVTVADYASIVKNVQLTPTAIAPSGLSASNVQNTSATLSWQAIPGATYNVRYRMVGSTNWTVLPANTNTLQITSLQTNTNYEVQVSSNCTGGGASSPYSTSINFTTTGGSPCIAPSGLSASNVQDTSATLSWQAISGATYNMRYRMVGITNWTVLPANTNTLQITSLQTNTNYEVQVRSNCTGGGASSPYSISINFTTTGVSTCTGISSFPFVESFESGLGVWTNATGDDINWIRDSGGTPSSSTGPSTGQNGSFYLFTEASGNSSPSKIALLNSPCIDLSALSSVSLEFGYHMYGATMGTMEVLISTDSGSTYSSIWSESGDLGNTWNQATVNLSSYSGSVVQLQFKGTTGSGWRSDMAIDNIKILSSTTGDTQAPTAPANLTTSNITSTSITLSWEPSTDNIGVTGYDIYQGATLIGTIVGLTSVVSGLTPNTAYTFTVKAKDAAGNYSPASNAATGTTLGGDVTYCNSQGNSINFEYIDLVSIGSFSNPSTATSGYSDYTNLSGAIVNYGANTITLSIGFASSSYSEFWGVWIDYNKNGVFETSEQVVAASTSSSDNQSYNFNTPATALGGETRMRVSMKYNTAPGACEAFAYGEVEDYTVNIGGVASKENNLVQNQKRNQLILYPNPLTNGALFIKGIKSKNATFRVLNFIGNTIMNNTLYGNKIDVNRLTSGMYILEVNTGQEILTKRFIIAK